MYEILLFFEVVHTWYTCTCIPGSSCTSTTAVLRCCNRKHEYNTAVRGKDGYPRTCTSYTPYNTAAVQQYRTSTSKYHTSYVHRMRVKSPYTPCLIRVRVYEYQDESYKSLVAEGEAPIVSTSTQYKSRTRYETDSNETGGAIRVLL